MSLKTLLNDGIVELELDAKNKEEVYSKIAKILYDKDRLKSIDLFIEDVKKQEILATTNMGSGVALPIVPSLSVKKTSFVVVRLKDKIDWEDYGTPVNFMFMLIGAHKSLIDEYKSSLIKLSELIDNKNFIFVINNTKGESTLVHRLKMSLGNN